jgi:hypothetical protein
MPTTRTTRMTATAGTKYESVTDSGCAVGAAVAAGASLTMNASSPVEL